MIEDLKGKAVLVTGASTGIGAAVARAFAANGARVAVHYHASREAAAALTRDIERFGGSAVPIQGDLTKRGAAARVVADAAKALDGLDILINNAGGLIKRVPIADFPDDLLDHVFDLNCRSLVEAARAAIPLFRQRGGGNIINTTSIAARHGGGAGALIYAAAKGFVSTLTRGMAKELIGDKIRVNAVAPGVIDTPFHERFTTAEQMAAMVKTIPMGRIGSSEECAGSYLYLASDRMSGYVTGQVIEVNGGQLMP